MKDGDERRCKMMKDGDERFSFANDGWDGLVVEVYLHLWGGDGGSY